MGADRIQVQEQPRRRGVDGHQEVHQLSLELPHTQEDQVGEPPQQKLPRTHHTWEAATRTTSSHALTAPDATTDGSFYQACHVGLLQRLHPDGHVHPSPGEGAQVLHLPLLLGPALPSACRGVPQRRTTPGRRQASGVSLPAGTRAPHLSSHVQKGF